MARRAHADAPLLVAHADRFVSHLEFRRARGRDITPGIVRRDALDEEVLRVAVGGREGPRHRVVAAEHDEGNAGKRAADHVALRRGDVREIPERRRLQAEMRIVGEERLAGFRTGARHGPVVRPDGFAGQRKCREQGARRRIEARVEGLEVRQRPRPIARIRRQELLGSIGADLRDEAQPRELGAPVAGEIPRHDEEPADRVGGPPALGRDAHRVELDRQDVPFVEERVHARRVRLEVRARIGVEPRDDAIGGARDAERAHEAIDVVGTLAEEFRQPALRDAALEFHLPEPVLRMDVAHREPAVALVRRADVRHAFVVAHDLDRRAHALDARFPVELRQGLAQVNPSRGAERENQDDHREEDIAGEPQASIIAASEAPPSRR